MTVVEFFLSILSRLHLRTGRVLLVLVLVQVLPKHCTLTGDSTSNSEKIHEWYKLQVPVQVPGTVLRTSYEYVCRTIRYIRK